MAYDAAKAHEYYMKYRKKGLKKGRKKGKGKAKTTNLVGLSSAGLNDAGKMQAAMIKEKIKKEMNAALSKAKTDVEKQKIREEYQQKALNEISKLKTNSQYAKAKATKSSSGSKSSKSSGSSKSSSGKSSGSGKITIAPSGSAAVQASVKNIQNLLTGLSDKISALPADQKEKVKTEINKVVTQIRAQLSNGPEELQRINWDKLSKSLKGK